MAGLWFEEFTEGMVIEHAITRTVSEADNLFFCSMTYNPQPLHIDRHFAEETEFGKPLVNSLLTLGMMIGLSVHETTLGTTVANLGMSDVRFPAPVFHGDTLHVRSTVKGCRASGSRPRAGIVDFVHEAFNQNGVLVARCDRAALMHRRPPQA
ncbi:nucleoside-diphosphate kinase [Profundibacterium mesophilum KAUST100406-0324]|uniref:Nucleoside-diphosphate kinase n=2 Tax=Profundibacterium TaxID=1258570 RepID=A0A921NRV4_9RHOB|nr:nucleoside-diphosphate kinase [Profundibacterium mesophilum KAUST100406-0324]